MFDPSNIDELLQQGIAAIQAGRKEEARQILMQVVELDERNEQGWLWLSGVVESSEDRRVCLENVLAINPNNAHAQAGLEWLDQNAPVPTAGQDRCPRCKVEVSPSEPACTNCGLPLIVACPACGQYADVDRSSCPHCGQSLGDFRQGARYHLALAQAYLTRQRYDRAQEALARAEAEAPDDPHVLASMAALYEKTARPDQAMAAYEQAIERDPGNATLYLRLGALYRQRAEFDKANAMSHKAMELSGQDPKVLLEQARLFLQGGGTTPEAVELLKQVVELQPMNAQAHLLLGDAYLGQQHDQQALQHYGYASKLTSPDSTVGLEARSKLGELQASLQPRAQRVRAGSGLVTSRKRPGCITAYALLTGIGAVLSALFVVASAILLSASRGMMEETLLMQDPNLMVDMDRFIGLMWIYVVVVLVFSTISLAIAIGLWSLKNWARIAVIVLQVLGVLSNLVYVSMSILSYRATSAAYGVQTLPAFSLCPLLFGFIIQGYIIFWFVANGDIFD